MALTVYGIPTCGTVKKARAWLDARDAAYTFVDFRAAPPSRDTVASWVAALGAGPMRNTSGGAYRALPDDKATWTDDQWIDAFARDPMLIRRPLVVRDGAAVQVGWRGADAQIASALGL